MPCEWSKSREVHQMESNNNLTLDYLKPNVATGYWRFMVPKNHATDIGEKNICSKQNWCCKEKNIYLPVVLMCYKNLKKKGEQNKDAIITLRVRHSHSQKKCSIHIKSKHGQSNTYLDHGRFFGDRTKIIIENTKPNNIQCQIWKFWLKIQFNCFSTSWLFSFYKLFKFQYCSFRTIGKYFCHGFQVWSVEPRSNDCKPHK